MDTSKQAQQSYDAMVKKASPNSPILSNCIKAFVSGGLICVLGQALLMLYTKKGISETDADYLRRAHAVCPVTAVQNRYSMMARWYENLFPVLSLFTPR